MNIKNIALISGICNVALGTGVILLHSHLIGIFGIVYGIFVICYFIKNREEMIR